MTDIATSRRFPWVALALSFLAAGVGHVYCGRIVKGLALYFAWFVVPLSITVAALGTPSTMRLMLLVVLPSISVMIVYWYAAIDAWRLANRMGSDYTLRDYNRSRVYWLLIVIQMVYPIGLTAAVRELVYEAFVIPTSSMSPTIVRGDRILVRKLLPLNHFPQRGDLVVFRNPEPTGGNVFVKRVVAVAGDRVEIQGERLLINDQQVVRDRVPDESLRLLREHVDGPVAYEMNGGRRYLVSYAGAPDDVPPSDQAELTIPKRHVYLLGDNRDRSKDSRHFGSVHVGDIIGYVDYIYWPSESWSRLGVANDRLP